jgi:hypothetical protein
MEIPILLAAAWIVAGQQPPAACRSIEGSFESTIVRGESCKSVHCTEGRLSGGVDGAYAFTMNAIDDGDPGTADVRVFRGRTVVTIGSDELIGVDAGLIELPPGSGNVVSLVTWKGGTGAFARAAGQIRVSGVIAPGANTVKGSYAGSLCHEAAAAGRR